MVRSARVHYLLHLDEVLTLLCHRVRNRFTAINADSVVLEGWNRFATVTNVACAFPSRSLKRISA